VIERPPPQLTIARGWKPAPEASLAETAPKAAFSGTGSFFQAFQWMAES
jgi:hypothetical protein